jgi:hypothetical protein
MKFTSLHELSLRAVSNPLTDSQENFNFQNIDLKSEFFF